MGKCDSAHKYTCICQNLFKSEGCDSRERTQTAVGRRSVRTELDLPEPKYKKQAAVAYNHSPGETVVGRVLGRAGQPVQPTR